MDDVEVAFSLRHTQDLYGVALVAVPNRDLAVAFELRAVDTVSDPLVTLVRLNDKIRAPCCLDSCTDQQILRRIYLGCDRLER